MGGGSRKGLGRDSPSRWGMFVRAEPIRELHTYGSPEAPLTDVSSQHGGGGTGWEFFKLPPPIIRKERRSDLEENVPCLLREHHGPSSGDGPDPLMMVSSFVQDETSEFSGLVVGCASSVRMSRL